MLRVTGFSIAALFAVLVGASFQPAWSQQAAAGDAANGKKVYLVDGCFECHGRVGEGGAMNGPAPILAQTKLPFEAFKEQLRNPVNDMPPYPDAILSDKDLTDMFAFLRALPGPRATKDVPIINN
jgi:mono/diheme cytochrome c family protein